MVRTVGRKLTRRERLAPHNPDNTTTRIVNEMIRNKVPIEDARKKLGKWPYYDRPEGSLVDPKVRNRIAREFAKLGTLYPKKAMTLEGYTGKLEKAYADHARKEYPGDELEEENAREFAKQVVEFETKRAKEFGTPSRGKAVWRYKDWRYPTERENRHGHDSEEVSRGRIAVGAKEKRVRYYKPTNPDEKMSKLSEKYEDRFVKLQGKKIFPKFGKYYQDVCAGKVKSKVIGDEEKKISNDKVKLEPHIVDFLNSASFGGDIEDVLEGRPAPVRNLFGSHLAGVLLRRGTRGEEQDEVVRKFAKEALPNEPPFVHALIVKEFAEHHGKMRDMLLQTFPDYQKFVMQKWESERKIIRA